MAKKLDYHAKLTIHGLDKMIFPDIGRIVIWLRKLSNDMSKEQKRIGRGKDWNYGKLFTAKLMK